MDVNNIVDLAPFGLMLAAVIGAVVGYLRLRSQVVLINPDTLIKQEQRINDAFERLDKERERRVSLEAQLYRDRTRIASLEHNEQMNQRRMKDLENTLDEWSKGIEILIEQIKRHDSRPNWTPYGDKGK